MPNGDHQDEQEQSLILFENAQSPIKLEQQRRTIRTHSVTDQELTAIAAPSGSLSLALAGMTFGALVTCIVTLTTVRIDDPRTYAAYVASTITSFILTVFLGFNGVREMWNAKSAIEDLRKRS